MDNLTHGLVGALIGQAGLKRKTGLAMPALVIGANLPDVDAACFIWLDGVQHLGFRRGITHGPIAWVILPLILAGLLWGWDRWQAKRGRRPEGRLPVRFGWLYALAFIACLTHPALDWLNSYGIRFLAPFSWEWFYGDALFIIDLWVWLGLGAATWLSLRRERSGRDFAGVAHIALAIFVLYAGGNAAASRLDKWMNSDSAVLIPNPVPLAFWNRQYIMGDANGIWWVNGQRLGDMPLDRCSLALARKSDPQLDAFLTWSRAPFIDRLDGGQWEIRDARFASRGGRFKLILPEGTCPPRESLPRPS
ncbi:MAG: metal-dependent hydrolase [Croceibacterium sp.]|jgi:inner membrane protein